MSAHAKQLMAQAAVERERPKREGSWGLGLVGVAAVLTMLSGLGMTMIGCGVTGVDESPALKWAVGAGWGLFSLGLALQGLRAWLEGMGRTAVRTAAALEELAKAARKQ
jgi:hypothetical protein